MVFGNLLESLEASQDIEAMGMESLLKKKENLMDTLLKASLVFIMFPLKIS